MMWEERECDVWEEKRCDVDSGRAYRSRRV